MDDEALRRILSETVATVYELVGPLCTEEAADVIWATNSSELYVLLTVERGWPADRYERWLADTWCRLLLPDTARAGRAGRD